MNPSTESMLLRHPSLIGRAIVMAINDDGSVMVTEGGADGDVTVCDVLASESGPLRPGDPVLVWHSESDPRGVVVGRIGGGAVPAVPQPGGPPDELVIEAGKSLTLRVGDGSITIREDGRILIKGRELVSHAKGMNRIRGGSVAIN